MEGSCLLMLAAVGIAALSLRLTVTYQRQCARRPPFTPQPSSTFIGKRHWPFPRTARSTWAKGDLAASQANGQTCTADGHGLACSLLVILSLPRSLSCDGMYPSPVDGHSPPRHSHRAWAQTDEQLGFLSIQEHHYHQQQRSRSLRQASTERNDRRRDRLRWAVISQAGRRHAYSGSSSSTNAQDEVESGDCRCASACRSLVTTCCTGLEPARRRTA